MTITKNGHTVNIYGQDLSCFPFSDKEVFWVDIDGVTVQLSCRRIYYANPNKPSTMRMNDPKKSATKHPHWPEIREAIIKELYSAWSSGLLRT